MDLKHLPWKDSASSNVAKYAHHDGRLYVQFRNGSAGYYDNVPAKMFDEFHTATSHGKFLHGRLKSNDKHPWRMAD